MQESFRSAVLLGLVFFAIACGVAPALAQSGVTTPKPGSAERKAILDALRVPVQRDLKMPVIFVVHKPVHDLRVKQGWAFVVAEFRHSNGDPMGPAYFAETHGGSSSDACGLLHLVHGRWRIVDHMTGPSDVYWGEWQREHHTPPGLVPDQETNH